ncbi:hypothetical protein [Phenylobacterium aquaticum]|uniref:hypothetical protein n=1 Tax=Phenylobacterium aquaticum TaxID=1763816 RepID=UPI001F5D7A00|nr:hypothetical protein [Phenylobacterium aquaticum]MCI3132737.1 hypothetical protein [Phenylobacterium aquaticum]
MTNKSVQTKADLAELRTSLDLDHVTVHTQNLKYRGLMPLALKYALFALRPGGRLEIIDAGGSETSSPAFEIAFNLVRQWTFKLIGRDVTLIDVDPRAGRMVLERTRPVTPPGWAAGVIFSGADAEIPVLEKCLLGLLAQPELIGEGGDIAVCGPTRDLGFLAAFPAVRYLPYDPPASSRFLVGAKKNFLVASLSAPRVAVMHARIVLQPGALAATPREFDIGSPNVLIEEGGRLAPYLSLCFTDATTPGRMPRRLSTTLRNVWKADPLEIHQLGAPYVDGGVFMAMRSVYDACSLDPNIAWGEAEDVEWCYRAAVNGYLVDLFPTAIAVSQTNKLARRPHLSPGLKLLTMHGVRAARHLYAAARHILFRISGVR